MAQRRYRPHRFSWFPAQQVAREVAARTAANGLHYAPYGDTRVTEADLTRMVESVPKSIADALTQKAYYFVPLTLGDRRRGTGH